MAPIAVENNQPQSYQDFTGPAKKDIGNYKEQAAGKAEYDASVEEAGEHKAHVD